MSFRKFLFPLLLLLPAACATPQKEATFRSFLEGFEECGRMDFSCYEEPLFLHYPEINVAPRRTRPKTAVKSHLFMLYHAPKAKKKKASMLNPVT